MPDDRCSRMTELVFARTFVVVTQQEIILHKEITISHRRISLRSAQRKLTSKLAKQYQQKTCLHRLHIICAQPSSFSMGTAHIGQHFIRSLSNSIIESCRPPSLREFSSQVIDGCHWREKNLNLAMELKEDLDWGIEGYLGGIFGGFGWSLWRLWVEFKKL